jgi:hypothetical protein
MNDFLIGYGLTIVFVCVVVALLLLYRYFVSEKYILAERKLRARVNEVAGMLREVEHEPEKMVSSGLEGLDINGLIDSLPIGGIGKSLVKGFLSNPQNIEMLTTWAKEKGFNLESPMEQQKGGFISQM